MVVTCKSSDFGEILTKKQPPNNDRIQNNDISDMIDGNHATIVSDDPTKKELDKSELIKEITTSGKRKKER